MPRLQQPLLKHASFVRGANVNLRKLMIELDISDIQEILRIDMDEDPEQALKFIKEVLAKQVKTSLQPH